MSRSSIQKQIVNMEGNLFDIEVAIDAAGNRKEEEELYRKRNKFKKKLRKLKRRAGQVDTSEDVSNEWI